MRGSRRGKACLPSLITKILIQYRALLKYPAARIFDAGAGGAGAERLKQLAMEGHKYSIYILSAKTKQKNKPAPSVQQNLGNINHDEIQNKY